jgi:cobalt-zinc-cadmium efflux system protein
MAQEYRHDADEGNLRRVLIALVLTGAFMVVEVVGGIISGSLALLADAGHMLTDTMALALAAAAFHVSKRPAGGSLTYGYQRFQILAAFVNGLSLLVIVGWIFFEAVERFITPREILGETMLLVAAAGLVVNIVAFAVLHSGDQENLNIRGAALHVAGDLLGSVAAMVAAVIIIYTGWTLIDPILSVAVAFLILRSAWTLVKRSSHVLLEGAPEWLDVEEMQTRIVDSVSGVRGIHHVHVWGLTPQKLMLTMHLDLEDSADSQSTVVREVKAFLQQEYGIGHSTADVRQRAVPLGVVEPVADDPLVADIEPEVVDVDLDLGPFRLADECTGPDGRGTMGTEHADQVLERMGGIDDILDDQDVLAFDVAAHVHDQPHGSRRRAAAIVARYGDELDRAGDCQFARQIGQENERALQHADQHELIGVGIVRGDLRREFAHARLDFFFA